MRITGGSFRSRLLASPKGDATRPTSDRVREALFGILAAQGLPAGGAVLDLFAGTGSLGLEALSRGAERAVFVEERRETARALLTNRDALAVADRAEVIVDRVERALTRPLGPFALIFADPPYKLVTTPPFAELLAKAAALLAPEGLLILEHASRDEAPAILGLGATDTRRYGDTTLTFYAADAGEENAADEAVIADERIQMP